MLDWLEQAKANRETCPDIACCIPGGKDQNSTAIRIDEPTNFCPKTPQALANI
jgi:hypothetical protein